MHFTSLDLNLLRVLDVLLEERSVTRAGARLGLTQSAVSHALNRLRFALNDELLLRGPSGMTPTPRALELGPQVHAALQQLQSALALSDFDPATTQRRFSVVAGAYACAVLVPLLVERLADLAPQAELVIAETPPDLLERLDARRVDFVIGGAVRAPERFGRETLIRESLAWVIRGEHPLAGRREVDLAALVSVPHVVIGRAASVLREEREDGPGLVMRASWEDLGAFENALASVGLQRRVGVIVPDTYSALAVVSRSDMAALIPRRLAHLGVESGRLALIEPPYASPEVELALLYLRERLSEPAIAWMRGLLREIAAEV